MKRIILGPVLILIIFSLNTNFSLSIEMDEPFYPISSSPYNKTYEEHIVDFWKSLVEIPKPENPVDNTETKCKYTNTLSNSTEILYVIPHGSGPSSTDCSIPAGKGLLLVVLGSIFAQGEEKTNPEEYKGVSPESLINSAKNDANDIDVDESRPYSAAHVTINDTKFYVSDYRINTTLYTANYPNNAIFNTGPGIQQVAVDGYYVITKPLEPGNYKIVFGGGFDPSSGTKFFTESTYNLTVR